MLPPDLLGRGRAVLADGRLFLTRGLWERDFSSHRGPLWLVFRELQVIVLAVRGLREKEVQLRAASLTLITLLSVVPGLAVIFSVFGALGGLQDLRGRIQTFIYENIAVGAQDDLSAWFDKLVSNVSGTAVGGIGFGVLVYAAVRLLGAMEQSFNDLWGVRRARPLVTRFVIYWVLLTVGPIALASSLAGTATLQTSLSDYITFPGAAWVFSLAPAAITVGILTLIYVVIPNTEVRFRHALLGGFVAGILFESAKIGYTWVASNLFAYNAVYGSLGAIPVFIIWVNIAWLIVLFGCLLTFANQNVVSLRHEQRAGDVSEFFRELVAARAVLEVGIAFHEAAPPPTAEELSAASGVSIRLLQETLTEMCKAGLLREASAPGHGNPGYVPARPLAATSLRDVIRAMRSRRGVDLEMTDDEVKACLSELLGRAEAAADEVYREADLLSLSQRFPRTRGAAARLPD